MRKKNISSKISTIILLIISIIILISLYKVYKKFYFNEFIRAEQSRGITTFVRDEENKYAAECSYKIESKDFNDALFYKVIKVEPNTPYRVRCMVKTEGVVSEEEKTDSGAIICINNSTEASRNVSRY